MCGVECMHHPCLLRGGAMLKRLLQTSGTYCLLQQVLDIGCNVRIPAVLRILRGAAGYLVQGHLVQGQGLLCRGDYLWQPVLVSQCRMPRPAESRARRAGELSAAELEGLMVIVANPRTFKIPDWFLNRQKDHKDGRYGQITSSALDTKLREDLERLKKIRCAPCCKPARKEL